MLLEAASLGALLLVLGLAAFALRRGVGVWASSCDRFRHDRPIAAPAAAGADRPDSPRVVSWRILPDPSWGMWPIPGDLLIAESAPRPAARQEPRPLAR